MKVWLILLGAVLIGIGVAWPWLVKLGLGRLPGDIHIEREGWSFYFPVTTSIVISLAVSLLIWWLRR